MLSHNLAFKVTLLIVSILIAGFGTLLVLNIRQETQALVVKDQETARLLASSVMETIEIGMLRVRPDIVRRLMQQLKTELKDVRRIGVYRRNGVEAFADLETLEEVNRKVHLGQEHFCNESGARAAQQKPFVPPRRRDYSSRANLREH